MTLSSPTTRHAPRLAIAALSVVALSFSSLSAFVSLARIGSSVGSQMDHDTALATSKNNAIQKMTANQEVAKAQSGVGLVAQKVVLVGYNYTDGTFFEAINDRSNYLKKLRDNTIIRDASGREIGYVKGGFACDSIAGDTCQIIK